MRRTIFIILSILLFLLAIQFLGFFVFAKQLLFERLSIEIRNELPEAPLKGVNVLYSNSLGDTTILDNRKGIENIAPNKSDKELFEKSLIRDFGNVSFIETDSLWGNQFFEEAFVLNYIFFYNSSFFSFSTYEGIYAAGDDGESYGYVYKRKLTWILFFWWEWNREDLGQS
jgi:hypothetical protein